MSALLASIAAELRRPRHVAAVREHPVTTAARRDGAILSAPCLRLRSLLPGSAQSICKSSAHLRGIRIFFVLFDDLGRSCQVLLRNDCEAARPLAEKPRRRVGEQ